MFTAGSRGDSGRANRTARHGGKADCCLPSNTNKMHIGELIVEHKKPWKGSDSSLKHGCCCGHPTACSGEIKRTTSRLSDPAFDKMINGAVARGGGRGHKMFVQ